MKVNKQELARLAALPDDALWAQIVAIASEKGLRLSPAVPEHEDLQKLRSLMCADRLSMTDAAKMLGEYRRKYRN